MVRYAYANCYASTQIINCDGQLSRFAVATFDDYFVFLLCREFQKNTSSNVWKMLAYMLHIDKILKADAVS